MAKILTIGEIMLELSNVGDGLYQRNFAGDTMNKKQVDALADTPLIAILRGITPGEAVGVSKVLVDAGFYFMEVTLDSSHWEDSIRKIKIKHGDDILLGAGTVLSPQDVERVYAAGGQAVISPNTCVEVIRRSKALGMISIPGCCTPTECFAALDAGADLLKIFPANVSGIGHRASEIPRSGVAGRRPSVPNRRHRCG